MIVYQLMLGSDHSNLNKNVQFIGTPDVDLIQIQENTHTISLAVDFDYMKEEYGIGITDQIVRCFASHREAWTLFEKSEFDWCLVIENKGIPQVSFSVSKEALNELPDDWDVFFPFDKSQHDTSLFEIPSVLGYYWGSYVYFLSKSGVKKLLVLPIIRQDVDEEILEGSLKGALNVYMNDSEDFCEDTSGYLPIYLQKQKEAKEIIFNTNVWTTHFKSLARKLLDRISNLAIQNDIDLVLHCGTLLGYVRHGGIMPWDDDVDLALEKSQLQLFIDIISKDKTLVIEEVRLVHTHVRFGLYKIWFQDGETVEGYGNPFPFVDVFVYKIEDDKIKFIDEPSFLYKDYYPLQNANFENAVFKVPSNVINCLNERFESWDKKIIINASEHIEGLSKPHLQTSIQVDENGRIINNI